MTKKESHCRSKAHPASLMESFEQPAKAETKGRQETSLENMAENPYREMVEFANSIILRLDRSGKILFANKFTCRFFGYTKEELTGKQALEILIPPIDSNGRDQASFIESIFQNPEPYKVHESENIRKDGSRVWILWTNRPILDEQGQPVGMICVGNDASQTKQTETLLREAHQALERQGIQHTEQLKKINEDLLFEIAERKVNEEALKENETKYRSIVEGAIEGIFQTTLYGKCTMANAALAGLLGYASPSEFLSATSNIHHLYVDTSQREELIKLLETQGCVKKFETKFFKKDQSEVWVSLNVRAVHDERGNFIHYQGTVIDITAEITLRHVLDETTGALSMAVEIRDPYTAGHQRRVTHLAVAIAREMQLTREHINAIRTAGMLHDVGKIYVPAEFLSKPGKISAIELGVLRHHATAGYEILKDIEYQYPIAEIVYQHHEKLDGSGYPRGLSGNQICLEAKMISVADVVEAMASPRPYRPALGLETALNEIRKYRGVHYDEQVVDICLKLFHEKGFRLES